MPKIFKNQADREQHNKGQLSYIAEYLLERLQSDADKQSVETIIKFVTEFLNAHEIALDIDDHTLVLKDQLFKLISKNQQDRLLDLLENWSACYAAAAERAEKQSEENRRQHASQPHGIYRGLTEKSKIGYQVWGEDLDILMVLKGILVSNPKDITADGIYILPPVSLEGVEEKIKEMRSAHPDKTLTFLVPANRGQNHWQLAIVDLKNGKVVQGEIWDSFKAGVQKNGYSCMDYSVRQALIIKFAGKAPTSDLQAIIDAKKAQPLREAIVARIIHMHDKLHHNVDLQNSVREQVEQRPQIEKLYTIDVSNEDQLHEELKKNKNAQEEFDELMAIELDNLYKTSKETNETKLTDQARQLAYKNFLKNHGVFAPSSGSLPATSSKFKL